MVRAYEEFFSGYGENPREILQRTFEEIGNYDDIVVLRDIALESHCEHHMVPIVGRAHVRISLVVAQSACQKLRAWLRFLHDVCKHKKP